MNTTSPLETRPIQRIAVCDWLHVSGTGRVIPCGQPATHEGMWKEKNLVRPLCDRHMTEAQQKNY